MCTEHGYHLMQGCRTTTDDAPRLTRRTALATVAATAVAAAGVGLAGPAAASSGRGARRAHGSADLTYVLSEDTPAFTPGEEAVRRTLVTVDPDGYYMQEWRVIEHIGTHVDAPAHFVAGRRTADQLTLDELVTPAVVVDISAKAAADPDALVTVDDLRRFERRHGRIPVNCAVLMHSGWGAKAGDPDAYRGTDSAGVLHFPGFAPEAAAWLVERRRVRSVGVDTLSIDHGPSEAFETHLIVNGADRYGIENLANLHLVPPTGAQLVVGLIPFKDGSGGQARVFATW